MEKSFYINSITPVKVEKAPFTMDVDTRSFLIGSCFSENIYKIFYNYHLNSFNSPFGSIYNPISIAQSLKRLIHAELITKEECIISDGLYQHFDFHSKVGDTSINNYIEKINSSIKESSIKLLNSDLLIITLGTAFTYQRDGRSVNNCHKQPKSEFNRRVLEIEEIVKALETPLIELKKRNNRLNIVLTLSPVRHLRDDPKENSLSKAVLRVAIDKIVKDLDIYYFPSYEILLDELRDYRWYDESLNHPSSRAIEYITQKFFFATSSNGLNQYLEKIQKLNSMLSHRIINPGSETSQKFIKTRDRLLLELQREYYYLENLKGIRSSQYL
ncbi:GSCFA domain-containing protein [Thiospirochaeta perfilievii]|nr:GSCFA domain-containing protein [Thiospirochaeta perfilievii]